jgi:RHS repeat-associated protein
VLLGSALREARLEVEDLPIGAGHGEYWFVEWDPRTQEEGYASPKAVSNAMNTGGGSGQIPGFPSITPQYVHWDHLGSTRVVTDDEGQTLSKQKYFPFGHYVEGSDAGDTRLKFTGHERDEKLMLDYMLARYYGASLGRFLSVDPLEDSASLANTQSWNRYSYVGNNPIRFLDPDGLEYVDQQGKDLKDENVQQGNKDEKESVEKLDAEEEKVTTVVSEDVNMAITDSSGKAVPGTQKIVPESAYNREYNASQSQLQKLDPNGSKGYQVGLIGGEYRATVVDTNNTVLESTITIFKGSIKHSSSFKGMSMDESVRRVFAHESTHGLGPRTTKHKDFPSGIFQP